jgi:hypothetical protein
MDSRVKKVYSAFVICVCCEVHEEAMAACFLCPDQNGSL